MWPHKTTVVTAYHCLWTSNNQYTNKLHAKTDVIESYLSNPLNKLFTQILCIGQLSAVFNDSSPRHGPAAVQTQKTLLGTNARNLKKYHSPTFLAKDFNATNVFCIKEMAQTIRFLSSTADTFQ